MLVGLGLGLLLLALLPPAQTTAPGTTGAATAAPAAPATAAATSAPAAGARTSAAASSTNILQTIVSLLAGSLTLLLHLYC